MKRPGVIVVAVLSALLCGLLVYGIVQRGDDRSLEAAIERGERPAAPDRELPRLEGGGVGSLAAYRGKVVFLNFWASWCAPCKDEIPALERTWQQLRARGLVVVGVDIMDTGSDARSFARRIGISYPLVSDSGGQMLDRFSVNGLPQTLFVNRRGRLVGSRIRGGVHLDRNRGDFSRGVELALRQ